MQPPTKLPGATTKKMAEPGKTGTPLRYVGVFTPVRARSTLCRSGDFHQRIV